MALNFDRLQGAVEANTTVGEGTKTVLVAIVAELKAIKDASNEPAVQAQLDALATQLEAGNADQLATNLLANTPEDPEEPPVEPTDPTARRRG